VNLGISYMPGDANYGAIDWRETSFIYWSQVPAASSVSPTLQSDFIGLGRLYQTQIVKSQLSFNCPTAIANGALPNNYWLNRPQWPPYDQRNQAGLNSSGVLTPNGWPETKATYSRRPAPPRGDSNWVNDPLAWRLYMPGGGVDFVPQGTASGDKTRYPKFGELNQMAIMADLTGGQVFLDAVHKDGVNVAYADGSAHWVAKGVMKDGYTLGQSDIWPAPFKDTHVWTAGPGGDVDRYHVSLWMDFDKN
jgi:prepilin-type processing-associated H-X9-DG protein